MSFEYKNISDAYAILEMYEMGSVDQQEYLRACSFVLKLFEKKYGKDDFRYRELFAQMQGDDWTNSFTARYLAHAELIGCFHKTLEECEKHMAEWELQMFKGKQCQHCRLLTALLTAHKEEYERKDKSQ